jgi:transcriptional regulator with GAF, ATPase, and Fis domain
VIERAVILSPANTLILTEELHPVTAGGRRIREIESLQLEPENVGRLDDMTRRHIKSVLDQTNWMIEGDRGAAKILNMNPSTLRSRMQKLGIKRLEKRS